MGAVSRFLFCRSLHSTCVGRAGAGIAVEKSVLAKLRRSTGYSFSRCKEALEKHNNELKEAEKWLKSEAQTHGWQKATKLQGRATAQGLISVLASPNNAVMLEMNCETDFVARNKKFQTLVQKVTQACFAQASSSKNTTDSSQSSVFKNPLNSIELSSIPVEESLLTKDQIALAIGDIGENIQGRRALLMQSSDSSILLSGYVHPASPEAEKQKIVQFGKFGAIVAYKVSGSVAKNSGQVTEIGRQLCQHIVGMNPKDIGPLEAPPKQAAPPPPPPTEPEAKLSSAEEGAESEETEGFTKRSEPEVDESSLLNQEFLLDPELTVRDFLLQNNTQVVDFVRFECGESLPNND